MGRKRENPEIKQQQKTNKQNHLVHPQAELCLSHMCPVCCSNPLVIDLALLTTRPEGSPFIFGTTDYSLYSPSQTVHCLPLLLIEICFSLTGIFTKKKSHTGFHSSRLLAATPSSSDSVVQVGKGNNFCSCTVMVGSLNVTSQVLVRDILSFA